ncbi:hypothetical protein BDQ94DRAFT_167912 [Aspergillus welwitschiae]|uniref:DUF7708 domain-containing protein n=1 Tax=Aspergillus welwitschiae TaxID=1341132 RepID=A0A3F3QAN6_9EURO|nr:hypothetical protein BDQ94DRAFT_167912 [Aspergillus welwitschiae]RDH36294.1 hypothetical protein BDQ94DRAFT_167912 [Aspergillus welwitschiae]
MTQPPISSLIRRYSMKAEHETPHNPLTQALSSTIKHQDELERQSQRQAEEWTKWLKFGEATDDAGLKRLDDGRRSIVEIWQRFREHHHELPAVGAGQLVPEVPNITTLRNIVQDAQVEWQAKRSKGLGKIKSYVADFLEMMDDHSYLFKFIPTGDKYISLITGVVSSVVKICANYKRIAEGFFSALVDLSSDVRLVQKKTDIWDSPDMRTLVVDYYVMVFEFLCNAMSWFSRPRHRYRTILDRSSYDHEVRDLRSRSWESTASWAKFWSIDASGIDVSGKFLYLHVVGSGSRGDSRDATQAKLHHFGQLVGSCSLETLQDIEKNAEYVRQSVTIGEKPVSPRDVQPIDVQIAEVETLKDESDSDADMTCTRYDIQKATLSFAEYTEDGREELSNALRGNPSSLLPQEVLGEIQNWVRSPQSKMIWIEGDPLSSYGSNLSLAAMQLCAISTRAHIPYISFFCKPRYDFATNFSNQEASVIALLHTIIAQLTRLLPADFHGAPILLGQFELLDGAIGTASTALNIIRELLVHAPPSIIWVIDGLHLAENSSTIHILDDFVAILREQERFRLSKVCFTTDGNSHTLLPAIMVNERVDASRMALAGPRRHLYGGGDIFAEMNSW